MKQGGSAGEPPQSPTTQVLSSLTQPPTGNAPVAADSDSASLLSAPDE
jgi:hypothetical protein